MWPFYGLTIIFGGLEYYSYFCKQKGVREVIYFLRSLEAYLNLKLSNTLIANVLWLGVGRICMWLTKNISYVYIKLVPLITKGACNWWVWHHRRYFRNHLYKSQLVMVLLSTPTCAVKKIIKSHLWHGGFCLGISHGQQFNDLFNGTIQIKLLVHFMQFRNLTPKIHKSFR